MGVARWMVDFMDNPFFKIDELGVALLKKKQFFFASCCLQVSFGLDNSLSYLSLIQPPIRLQDGGCIFCHHYKVGALKR